MHEQALFAGDLLKAREIMGEDRPWELRRLGREVRDRHKNKHAPYTYIYCLYASSHKRQ